VNGVSAAPTMALKNVALSNGRRSWIRVAIWLAAYIVACAAFVAVRDRSIFVSVLAIFGIVGAARQLHGAVRQWADRRRPSLRKCLPRVLVLVAAGAVLIALWWLGWGDGWGFFGLAILYLGLGLVVEQLRNTENFAERWGWPILATCAALALVGVVCMAAFGSSWAMWLTFAGIALAPIGLSLVSGARNRALAKQRPISFVVLATLGAALFLGGLGLMLALDVHGGYVALFATGVFVFVLAIAARTNADVVLVVAMAAVVWTLTSRTVPVTDAVTPSTGEEVIVALGDSYISGEGADAFFEGTNIKGVNQCRRAPTAYPALLTLEKSDAVPRDLVFLACSGAKANGVRSQLRDFQQLPDVDVRFVLLSVGGNDALFGSVGETCLLPGDCSELGAAWTDHLREVGSRLDALYANVRATFPDTPILVVPYPVPIRERGCSSSVFTNDEHQFLHGFTVALNRVVQRAAADAGFHFVDSMRGALAGRQLCDEPADEVGVNFLAANSVAGTLEQTVSPLNWFHNSLHPNVTGHELMRSSLMAWLEAHPGLTPVAPSDGVTITPPEPGGGTGDRCRDSENLDACTSTWMREQVGWFMLTKGLIALLVAAGAWLLALCLIRLWRHLTVDVVDTPDHVVPPPEPSLDDAPRSPAEVG